MATLTEIEKRLESVEKAVAEIREKATGSAQSGSWLDRVIGSVTDAEAFSEALEYGRAYRGERTSLLEDLRVT